MNAHTPGPWVVHPMRSSRTGLHAGTAFDLPWHIVPATEAKKPIGGALDSAEDLQMFTQTICTFNDFRHRENEEIIANGSLIAAAPELLEALELLIAPDNGVITAAELKTNFARARAAIRKAKGEL